MSAREEFDGVFGFHDGSAGVALRNKGTEAEDVIIHYNDKMYVGKTFADALEAHLGEIIYDRNSYKRNFEDLQSATRGLLEITDDSFKAGLEAAAKVCDDLRSGEVMSKHIDSRNCESARGAERRCAESIRKLKDD